MPVISVFERLKKLEQTRGSQVHGQPRLHSKTLSHSVMREQIASMNMEKENHINERW